MVILVSEIQIKILCLSFVIFVVFYLYRLEVFLVTACESTENFHSMFFLFDLYREVFYICSFSKVSGFLVSSLGLAFLMSLCEIDFINYKELSLFW